MIGFCTVFYRNVFSNQGEGIECCRDDISLWVYPEVRDMEDSGIFFSATFKTCKRLRINL